MVKRGKKEKLKTGDKFKSTVTGKELADFLHEYEDKHGKEIEALHKKGG